MKNIKEKIIKNKIQILYTALAALLFFILGFYSGRYYQIEVQRINFTERRSAFTQQKSGNGTNPNTQRPNFNGSRFQQ